MSSVEFKNISVIYMINENHHAFGIDAKRRLWLLAMKRRWTA